jgi:hypothetical protein
MNVRIIPSPWKRCTLSVEQLRAGALIQITNNFMRLIDDMTTSTDAMMFWRATFDGLEFFASPDASALLRDPALAHYDWIDCVRPEPVDLIVLAGRGDPQRLFVPRRFTVISNSPQYVDA